MSETNKNIIIKKETITRLLSDLKAIRKNPLTENGIYYNHDDEDLLKGYAMIVGPSDTPYFGGFYFFKLSYPTDYPHSPPVVTYHTNGDNIRFNPNLYKCGKVCVSLLNTWRGDQWTSCQTISTVLLTLCTLLCKDPLLNEPGFTLSNPDCPIYDKIIEYKNVELAMLHIINRKTGVYDAEFEMFYPIVKSSFLENADKVIKFLESKKTVKETAATTAYKMTVQIDYEKLLGAFNEVLTSIKC
jgi:ubiquitin-conjugating enzyme E2 Z